MSINRRLGGVQVGITEISTYGKGTGLIVRGYDIRDLGNNATFEQLAFLLLYGTFPNNQQEKQLIKRIAQHRKLSQEIKEILKLLPKVKHPVEILRTGCSLIGSLQPEQDSLNSVIQLIGALPSILLFWYQFHYANVEINTDTDQKDTVAVHYYKLLNLPYKNTAASQDELIIRAIDTALVLFCEQEMSPSTLVARTIASTQSDIYSSIIGSLGTTKGFLTAGASQKVLEMLEQFTDPGEAVDTVSEMIYNGQLVWGFGHRVYKKYDPRANLMKNFAKQLSERPNGDKERFKIQEAIENYMLGEVRMPPNVHFWLATTLQECGIPPELFSSLLAIARLPSWGAHVIEQIKDNHMIRPIAHYKGVPLRIYEPKL